MGTVLAMNRQSLPIWTYKIGPEDLVTEVFDDQLKDHNLEERRTNFELPGCYRIISFPFRNRKSSVASPSGSIGKVPLVLESVVRGIDFKVYLPLTVNRKREIGLSDLLSFCDFPTTQAECLIEPSILEDLKLTYDPWLPRGENGERIMKLTSIGKIQFESPDEVGNVYLFPKVLK